MEYFLTILLIIFFIFIFSKFKKSKSKKNAPNSTPSHEIKKVSQEKHESKCPYLFDAGNYGGVRYFCDKSSSPGMFGRGTRIPMYDQNQLNNFCTGNYSCCPLYALNR